jgi:hypothetical protein
VRYRSFNVSLLPPALASAVIVAHSISDDTVPTVFAKSIVRRSSVHPLSHQLTLTSHSAAVGSIRPLSHQHTLTRSRCRWLGLEAFIVKPSLECMQIIASKSFQRFLLEQAASCHREDRPGARAPGLAVLQLDAAAGAVGGPLGSIVHGQQRGVQAVGDRGGEFLRSQRPLPVDCFTSPIRGQHAARRSLFQDGGVS